MGLSKTKTEIPVFALGLLEIPAYRLQMSGRKQEDFYSYAFISESESEIDAEEKIPAFFLTVVAGMPVFPAKTGISVFAQSFGFGFAQPLANVEILIPVLSVFFHLCCVVCSSTTQSVGWGVPAALTVKQHLKFFIFLIFLYSCIPVFFSIFRCV